MSDRDMVGQVYGAGMMSPSYRAGQRVGLVVLALLAVIGTGVYLIVKPSDSGACSAPVAEPIDPLSSQHLLPNAPEPKFSTDPPTSGAHKPGTYATGFVKGPIARPVQVTLLEQGEVLVQYRTVPAATSRQLRGFVGKTAHVTVAPNASLRSPIVVTAWLWKMNCQSFDASALRDFVDAHQPAQPVSS